MDKSQDEAEVNHFNETITNPDELDRSSRSKSESPVFKCFNNQKSNRGNRFDSSECDIPCYQINQSSKSRVSSNVETDENDSCLPFSPLLSPILAPPVQFKPPSVHSLGTLAKKTNFEKFGKNVHNNRDKECKDSRNVFESLGMTDKDISWVSSMASPAPHMQRTDFNTIEKATFLPEEKFQNIQPRALFSPTLDEDFGCQPLTFTSESEDDEAYKTNMRLSDVCATLKQLVVMSNDVNQNTPEACEKAPSSPVIKTHSNKDSAKKKSATKKAEYDFVVGDEIQNEISFSANKENRGSSQSICFTEDDSFQSISFSCLDELCKTLGNTTDQSESTVCDKTLIDAPFGFRSAIPKPFYATKTESEVYKMSSMSNLHSSAMALEKGDVVNQEGCSKVEKSFADKGIVRFNVLDRDLTKIDSTKRLHSEVSEKDDSVDKKVKIEDGNWEDVKDYLSESQLNVIDTEILKTAEHLEETVKNIKEDVPPISKIPESFMAFQTASGTKVSVSEKALAKAKEAFKKLEENPEDFYGNLKIKAFSTCKGTKIQVSSEALEKAKALMLDCSEIVKPMQGKKITISSEAFEKAKALMCDDKAVTVNFPKTVKVSPEALEKAKALMLDCSKIVKPMQGKKITVSSEAFEKAKAFMCNDKAVTVNFPKTVKVSPEALEKAKELMEDIGKFDLKAGFSTGLGKRIEVSDKALEKAKALMLECDEAERNILEKSKEASPKREPKTQSIDPVPHYPSKAFTGFLTGLGKKVEISEEALQKGRALMSDVDNNLESESGAFATDNKIEETSKAEERVFEPASEDWSEIIPSWLHSYTTSPSIASDRLEQSPLVTHEDGSSYVCDRQYIVKSPVLGCGDRFFKRVKRKKLVFDTQPEAGSRSFNIPYKDSVKKGSTKRGCSNLSIDFSIPFKKFKPEPEKVFDVRKGREKARAEQEKLAKEKDRVKPQEGSHRKRKLTEKQMKWLEAVEGSHPDVYPRDHLKNLGVKEDVLGVDIENAAYFKFLGEKYLGSECLTNIDGIPLGDGCLLILDDDNRAGIEEFKRAFLASPGVQPNLVADGWIENHYKWIIWKLAHYERAFPRYFGGRCLTPENVLLQLKYRYDREIDRNERSALKKILERDDSSVKRMVLCVCGIKKVQDVEMTEYEINLTDGWYSCPARSDPAMTRLIEEGRLRVGTKLIMQGAVLVNCEQGTCPLEIGEGVYLKISTNSTRRVKWDVKLGFQKNPENFAISLGSVLPQGGSISRLDVIIVRIYPMLYMERTSDGRRVTRNLRCEEKADADYRKIQEQKMEAICKEVQSEIRKSAKGVSNKMLKNMEQEDLCMMESCSDPSALQEALSFGQRQNLQNLHLQQTDRFAREMSEKIEKRMKKEKLNKREVSEFLRMRIVDLKKPDYNNPAVLSVWNPNEEIQRLFSEGKAVSITNVSVGNSRICRQMQINTTRQTQYKKINRSIKYPARKVTLLKEVSSKLCPVFEEVDLVGVVAKLQDVSYGSRMSQVVYLADLEFNFVGIVFWGCCGDYGWENVLKPRSVVACSNLQWNKHSCLQDIPSLHVNENSVFTENPKLPYLKEKLDKFKKSLPQDVSAYFAKCEEDLAAAIEEGKWRANTSRNDSSLSDIQPLKPKCLNGFESKPTACSTPLKPFSVGFDSGEADPSPIQKRIEKLQSYGEPPPLLPLIVSKNVKKYRRKK